MNDDLKLDEERARFLAALAEFDDGESDLAGWFGNKSSASKAADGKFYLVEGQTYTSGDEQYTPQADKSILYVNSKTKESTTLTPGTEYYNNVLKMFNAAGVKTKRDWAQIASVAGGFLNQLLGIQTPVTPTTTTGSGSQLPATEDKWSAGTWALVIGGSLAVVVGGYFAYRALSAKKKD